MEDLPFLEFATMTLPVYVKDVEESKSLDLLRSSHNSNGGPALGSEGIENDDSMGTRTERVDGFRSR